MWGPLPVLVVGTWARDAQAHTAVRDRAGKGTGVSGLQGMAGLKVTRDRGKWKVHCPIAPVSHSRACSNVHPGARQLPSKVTKV